MPPASTMNESCYSPLVGASHQRIVILPDGLLDNPSARSVPPCASPDCHCAEATASSFSALPYDTPLRYFRLFFTPLVFSTLAMNTNLYAAEKHAGETGRPWWPCSAAELKIWIGTLIYLSVFGTTRPDELWTKNSNFPQHCISRVMSKVRWEQIKRYFHCSPPNPNLSTSQFFEKLEPIATMLQESFQKVVVPATNVAIDECMIRFTGRSKHTVMIRGKPVPVGYYILALCEAGYMFAFSFKGAAGFSGLDLKSVLEKRLPQHALSSTQSRMKNQLSATSNAVLNLVLQLPPNRFFCLFCDNLFSTPDLFHILRHFGIGACGTARSNRRNWPLELKKIDRKKDKLQYNSMIARIVHGDVAAIVWQDKSLVQFLTTAHELHATQAVERRRFQANTKWEKETVDQVWGSSSSAILNLPKWSVDYNNNMGGVDRHDQLRSYHPVQLKTFRNWMALFFFLLDAAVINAYLVCKDSQPNYKQDPLMKQHIFRIRLAWNLVTEGLNEMNPPANAQRTQSRQRRTPTRNTAASRAHGYVSANYTLPAIRLVTGNHQRNGRYESSAWCVRCRWLKNTLKQNVKVRRTMFYCSICGEENPLCKDCFPQWHSG